MNADELQKKLEKVSKQSEQWMQDLSSAAQQLRAICFGQDRYWRRYWSLPRAGGIFVEAIESAEPQMYSDGEEEESEDISDEPAAANDDDCKDEETKETESESKEEPVEMQTEESTEKIVENGLKEEKEEPSDAEMKDEAQSEKMDDSEVKHELKPVKAEATPKKEEPEEMDEDELENGEKFNPMSHLMRWGSPSLYNGVKDLNGSYNSKLDNSASSAYSGMASPGNISFGDKPWFSIIPRDSCDENSLTKPPFREQGLSIPVVKGAAEIRIPWFPRPQTSASPLPAASPAPSSRPSLCDSPPLFSAEETAMHIEHLKKLGETVEAKPRPIPRGTTK